MKRLWIPLLLIALVVACNDRDATSTLKPGDASRTKLSRAELLPPPRNDYPDHFDLVVGNPDDTSNVEGLLTLTAYDSRGGIAGHTGNISYVSADPSIATVDAYGVVRGQREGETLVTATVQSVSASLLICVSDHSIAAPTVVVPHDAPLDSTGAIEWQWAAKQGGIVKAFRADGTLMSNLCVHWSTSDSTQARLARNGALTFLTATPIGDVRARAYVGSLGAP